MTVGAGALQTSYLTIPVRSIRMKELPKDSTSSAMNWPRLCSVTDQPATFAVLKDTRNCNGNEQNKVHNAAFICNIHVAFIGGLNVIY